MAWQRMKILLVRLQSLRVSEGGGAVEKQKQTGCLGFRETISRAVLRIRST
jgi:hypothetical protein